MKINLELSEDLAEDLVNLVEKYQFEAMHDVTLHLIKQDVDVWLNDKYTKREIDTLFESEVTPDFINNSIKIDFIKR